MLSGFEKGAIMHNSYLEKKPLSINAKIMKMH